MFASKSAPDRAAAGAPPTPGSTRSAAASPLSLQRVVRRMARQRPGVRDRQQHTDSECRGAAGPEHRCPAIMPHAPPTSPARARGVHPRGHPFPPRWNFTGIIVASASCIDHPQLEAFHACNTCGRPRGRALVRPVRRHKSNGSALPREIHGLCGRQSATPGPARRRPGRHQYQPLVHRRRTGSAADGPFARRAGRPACRSCRSSRRSATSTPQARCATTCISRGSGPRPKAAGRSS